MMNITFVFLFVITILYSGVSEVVGVGCKNNTLVFQNNLFSSHSDLKVHCESDLDDLGDHFVNFGSAYSFSFNDAINPTFYECNVTKGEYHSLFPAYGADIISRCGKLFTWNLRDDGIYLSTDDEPLALKYHWDADKSS